jgi:hypothetical protein
MHGAETPRTRSCCPTSASSSDRDPHDILASEPERSEPVVGDSTVVALAPAMAAAVTATVEPAVVMPRPKPAATKRVPRRANAKPHAAARTKTAQAVRPYRVRTRPAQPATTPAPFDPFSQLFQ